MFDMWGCNILEAAKRAEVSNKSFYNWYKTDPEFAAKIKAIRKAREEKDL